MPRKTDGDKIDELKEVCATLIERLNTALKELKAVYDAHSETVKTLGDLRRESEKELLLVKREIDDLKKWKEEQKKERDERSRKIWSFGPNIIAALISGVISAVVSYFMARR